MKKQLGAVVLLCLFALPIIAGEVPIVCLTDNQSTEQTVVQIVLSYIGL